MTTRYRLVIVLLVTLMIPSSSISYHQDRPEYIPSIKVTAKYRKPLNKKDLKCLAMNMYHEARGEHKIGKLAVGHVTLNRVKHEDYPKNICNVVHQRKQFSWYSDGKSDIPKDRKQWDTSLKLAATILLGETKDPTYGSTHFYNPKKARPYWRNKFRTTRQLGNHVFLKDT
jgi:N-acetylmuramoyl-L-alanine amidase